MQKLPAHPQAPPPDWPPFAVPPPSSPRNRTTLAPDRADKPGNLVQPICLSLACAELPELPPTRARGGALPTAATAVTLGSLLLVCLAAVLLRRRRLHRQSHALPQGHGGACAETDGGDRGGHGPLQVRDSPSATVNFTEKLTPRCRVLRSDSHVRLRHSAVVAPVVCQPCTAGTLIQRHSCGPHMQQAGGCARRTLPPVMQGSTQRAKQHRKQANSANTTKTMLAPNIITAGLQKTSINLPVCGNYAARS